VLQSRAPQELPRVTRDKTDQRCRYCDFFGACWSMPS
jgi:hypothetical protein